MCCSFLRRWQDFCFRHRNVFRWLSLATACLAMSASTQTGIMIYHDALKGIFNFSEVTMQWFIAIQEMGFAASLLGGYLHDRFGPKPPFLVALVIGVTVLSLMADATRSVRSRFYQDRPALMVIYAGLIGATSEIVSVCALATVVSNFSIRFRGLQIAFVGICTGVGTLFHSAIYNNFFLHGHQIHANKQDLGGFLLFWMFHQFISFGSAAVVSDVSYMPADNALPDHGNDVSALDSDGKDAFALEDATDGVTQSIDEKSSLVRRDAPKTEWVAYKDLNFLLLFFAFLGVFPAAVGVVNNTECYLRSYRFAKHEETLTIISPIVMVVSTVLVVAASDLIKRVPRSFYLLTSIAVFTIAFIPFSFYGKSLPILYVTLLSASSAFGISTAITPAIVSEQVDPEHFGKSFGLIVAPATVLLALELLAFGWLYNQVAIEEVNIYCYGELCFLVHNIVLLATLIISTICAAFFFWRTRHIIRTGEYGE